MDQLTFLTAAEHRVYPIVVVHRAPLQSVAVAREDLGFLALGIEREAGKVADRIRTDVVGDLLLLPSCVGRRWLRCCLRRWMSVTTRGKYEQKKKSKGKAKNPSSVLKEVRVRPKIDTHDLDIKIRKATEFLQAGHKVQVTCLFRGREMAYQDRGRKVLTRVSEALEELARIERNPRMEGRRMHLLLSRKSS